MARSERARLERIAFAVALGLAIPAVASCRGIVGLDDFRRGECPGALCADDGGPLDVFVPDAADAGDARPDAPKGADPVSWARWKMPNYPNDAGVPNVPTYTVVGSGDQVTDNVTNLVWQTKPLAQQTTQADSIKACAALPGGPWRVPKRIELASLVDYSRTPFLVDPAFSGIKNMVIWSSSEVRPFTGAADQAYWAVSFETGEVKPQRGDLFAFVLCVKGST